MQHEKDNFGNNVGDKLKIEDAIYRQIQNYKYDDLKEQLARQKMLD